MWNMQKGHSAAQASKGDFWSRRSISESPTEATLRPWLLRYSQREGASDHWPVQYLFSVRYCFHLFSIGALLTHLFSVRYCFHLFSIGALLISSAWGIVFICLALVLLLAWWLMHRQLFFLHLFGFCRIVVVNVLADFLFHLFRFCRIVVVNVLALSSGPLSPLHFLWLMPYRGG